MKYRFLAYRFLRPLILGFLGTNAVYVISGYESYSPYGFGVTQHLWLIWVQANLLILVLTIVFFFWFLGSLINRKSNYLAAFIFLLGAGGFAGNISGFMLNDAIKYDQYAAMTDRAKPLIDAIDAYVRKYGKPPEDLALLVPEFIPNIPEPDIPGTGSYQILVGNRAHNDNPWTVRASVAGAPIEFDEIYYCPLRNCTESSEGYLVPIGDWVYLEE